MAWPRFTIADFNKGYWMVELDPESCKLHYNGIRPLVDFQWTRLPMGSIVAQDVFSKGKLDAIFPWYTRCHRNLLMTWWIYGKKLTWSMDRDTWSTFSTSAEKNTLTLNPDKNAIQITTGFVLLDISGVPRGSVQNPKEGLQLSRGWILPEDVENYAKFF